MGGDQDAGVSPESFLNLGGLASTLVVRTWLEPRSGGPPVLRGTLAQLGGRMLGAFDSVETLAALVRRHMAETPGAVADGDEP
jgi:hypothetical protein